MPENKKEAEKTTAHEVGFSALLCAPMATEHDSPQGVKQELSGEGLPDSLLLFRIIDPKTKHEYKIYATGQIEGFPPGCFGMNYFSSQAIKFMLANKKTA